MGGRRFQARPPLAAGQVDALRELDGFENGNVTVIGDTPEASNEPTDCLSRNVRSADVCSSDRADVVATSRLAVERDIANELGADYVDTTDWLCTESACPMMIGDILLYRDATHITTVASEWFRPLLEATLAPILP